MVTPFLTCAPALEPQIMTLPSGTGSQVLRAQVALRMMVAPFSMTMKPKAASSMVCCFSSQGPQGLAWSGLVSFL